MTTQPIEIPGTTIVATVHSATEWNLIDAATGEQYGMVVSGEEDGERYMDVQRWRDGEMTGSYRHPGFGHVPLREVLVDAARYATTNP